MNYELMKKDAALYCLLFLLPAILHEGQWVMGSLLSTYSVLRVTRYFEDTHRLSTLGYTKMTYIATCVL